MKATAKQRMAAAMDARDLGLPNPWWLHAQDMWSDEDTRDEIEETELEEGDEC